MMTCVRTVEKKKTDSLIPHVFSVIEKSQRALIGMHWSETRRSRTMNQQMVMTKRTWMGIRISDIWKILQKKVRMANLQKAMAKV